MDGLDGLLEASIAELQTRMTRGEITSLDLVRAYLARIEAYDQKGPTLNAVSTINPDALEIAAALDAERAEGGPRGPLHGIPIIVKDNYETTEMETAAGSNVLRGWIPPHDAFLVTRLREAGAVILAKATMHEFAYGITNIGSRFGFTRNPYQLDRVPGGSSGGTGAAVAANFAAAGMGSDTSGSIRIPAALNNLVGLRATQGLLSRTGIVPLSSTQDVGGQLARSVADLALVMDALVGYDPKDPQTAWGVGRAPESYADALDAVGNTTAAIGKGFAIGSAALTALALFNAFCTRAGELLHVARLLEVGEGMQAACVLCRIQASVPREHDGLDRRVEGLDLLKSLNAVHLGHLEVQDRDVQVPVHPYLPDGLFPVVHVHHIPTPSPQASCQRRAKAILVIYEKDLGHGRFLVPFVHAITPHDLPGEFVKEVRQPEDSNGLPPPRYQK